MKYFLMAFVSILFISACTENKEEELFKDPHTNMSAQKMHSTPMFENPAADIKLDGQVLSFENIEMKLPAGWVQEKPSSSMRVIQFTSKDNNNLIIAGFYFGNRDNMVEPNINRWKSQFTEVDNFSKKEFASGKAVLVEIEGTHKNRPSEMVKDFEAAPGYKTIAAIVSTNNGPYFFKMVGPAVDVNKELKNFESFLNSYNEK
jgi:hypothetical protein